MFTQVIKELKEIGILDLFGIIVSPLISFIVLILTLNHSKKQFGIQIKNQESEHNESMKLMSEQHNQSLNENNRVLVMPYFSKNIVVKNEEINK